MAKSKKSVSASAARADVSDGFPVFVTVVGLTVLSTVALMFGLALATIA